MSNFLEELYSFSPASFFKVESEIAYSQGFDKNPYKKEYLLGHSEDLLDEEAFAKVAMCYSQEGIYLALIVSKSFEQVSITDYQQEDSFEVFIDTRDLKTKSSPHKFCHHFVFFPKEIDGKMGMEITKLRLEDSHPLCSSELLHVQSFFSRNQYEMRIFIESEALFGFDPKSFPRLGFSYRVNRKGDRSQHFNLSSEDYQIEKYPNLWAQLKLKSKES